MLSRHPRPGYRPVDIEGVVRAFDPSFFDGDGSESDYY